MKNIHVIPTDKPSRLGYLTKKGKEVYKDLRLFDIPISTILDGENQNIYITSDEKIKDGYAFYLKTQEVLKVKGVGEKTKEIFHSKGFSYPNDCKKIILTTDKDLIEDGIQSIDNEFLEWFIENSNCEHVQVQKILGCIDLDAVCDFGDKPCPNSPNCYKNSYKTIIPKEKPKQDFYKIGNFHEKCDDACKYHCTRGNTQLAECLKKQTAIEWLVEEIEKLQLKSDLETNVFFIRIVEKAKEMEKQQIIYAHLNGQAIFDKGKFRTEVVKNAEQYYNETFEK